MAEFAWLPEAPILVFENPPLATALCQVRFASVLGVADPTFVAPFQRAIQDDYPVASSSYSGQVEIGLGLEQGGLEVRKGVQAQQWRFADSLDNWTVVITHDFIALETRSYDHFSDFLERLRRVLEAVVEHIGPSLETRVGLRYVNEIRARDENWSSLIRRELLGPLSIPGIQEEAIQAIQQLSLRSPGGMAITILHGLLPSGTTVQPRQGTAGPSDPFYLLDFDGFREFQPPTPMDPDRICQEVEEFNRVIYRLFHWAVTTEYVATLEARQHGGC